ncbi:MAG: hypothetical protein Q9164_003708 [Protoblastenia rupestris]
MPDKPLTVFTYAASASLAAVAVVYLFHPNYLFDGDSSSVTASTRKKGIVGLSNPANDCFINCVLQSLAGLGDLRVYLIRELHRRELDGPEIYGSVPLKDAKGNNINPQKLRSLQKGEVTRGLKDMIDRLNERPLCRKTISAADFVRVLERAFGTVISKAQQDAQELLQIVAERLSEEYHAGRDARNRSKELADKPTSGAKEENAREGHFERSERAEADSNLESRRSVACSGSVQSIAEDKGDDDIIEKEDGFPLEGRTEARTECQYCHFTPKANPTSFVMLNLMVPQKTSSSLNDCFDAHFKTEYIDDYKCDKCRLIHAIEALRIKLAKAKTGEDESLIEADIRKLEESVNGDPEKPPDGVSLPDIKLAPKRKIARHIEITTFPKVLVIHLSRSMYDPRSSSMKNMAKVTFPERFPVGGLLNRRNYKLLGMVTHKGTHNSGHYETFRRQHSYAPLSNPHSDKATGPYSVGAPPTPSMKPSPSLQPAVKSSELSASPADLTPAVEENSDSARSSSPPTSDSQSLPSTRPSSGSENVDESKGNLATEAEKPTSSSSTTEKSSSLNANRASGLGGQSRSKTASIGDVGRLKRKKKPADRWWRISDDKIKECKTNDVLDMKKEVYMLFYEMEQSDEGG